MKKESKVDFVTWLQAELSGAPALVVADYRGLTVAQITALRNQCREAGVRFKVAKNTLTRRAVEGTEMDKVTEFLTGPTALAWHPEDPGAPARVMVEFLRDKKNEKLSIKGGVASGKLISAVEVREVLAKLPNRQELLSTLAFIITSAGATRLHRLMKSNLDSMHRCLVALKEQRANEAK